MLTGMPTPPSPKGSFDGPTRRAIASHRPSGKTRTRRPQNGSYPGAIPSSVIMQATPTVTALPQGHGALQENPSLILHATQVRAVARRGHVPTLAPSPCLHHPQHTKNQSTAHAPALKHRGKIPLLENANPSPNPPYPYHPPQSSQAAKTMITLSGSRGNKVTPTGIKSHMTPLLRRTASLVYLPRIDYLFQMQIANRVLGANS